MLDRLISGAGAVTDAADRLVRVFDRSGGGGMLGHRPGSVIVAGLCAVLAAILLFVGVEATDNPTARPMTPAQVASAEDIGGRTYATISGALASTYVWTFTDDNANGEQDADEDGISWFYFLVDPATRSGVTVRSTTPPQEVLRFEAEGVVVEDDGYVALDVKEFADEGKSLHVTLDPTRYLDATGPVGSAAPLVDLADGLPATGSVIRLSGARMGTYLPYCSGDADADGACDDDEVDLWDVAMFDPGTGVGIIVLVDEDPEFTPASFTGMLRRDEHAVSEAKTTEDFDFSTTDLDVTDTYLLEAGSAPASAPIAFGLAALLGLLAGIILIGLAGGYLVYRKATGGLPEPATTLAVGSRIPLRVTGSLRSSMGLVHVREAPADLVRFELAPASVEVGTPSEPEVQGGPAAPTGSVVFDPAPVDAGSSTLIIERTGRPEGVAMGLGELTRLSRGTVTPFRGRRPAIRASAGTGQLLLSFGSEADRDRGVAELLDETGLSPGDRGSAHV